MNKIDTERVANVIKCVEDVVGDIVFTQKGWIKRSCTKALDYAVYVLYTYEGLSFRQIACFFEKKGAQNIQLKYIKVLYNKEDDVIDKILDNYVKYIKTYGKKKR